MTYGGKHEVRDMFSAPDVRRDRLYAKTRPRRRGSDVLGYMRTRRVIYPARQKLYWIYATAPRTGPQTTSTFGWVSPVREGSAGGSGAGRMQIDPNHL